MMKTISILIPAYNEGENIDIMHERLEWLTGLDTLRMYNWEIIFVNDGSKDDTLKHLNEIRKRDSRYKVIDLARNFGKEAALLAGLDNATGDCVVIMDADLQHPVEKVPEMVEWWEAGYADVWGRRVSRGKEPWHRRLMTRIYYSLQRKLSGIETQPGEGDFRLLDRRAVDAITGMRESHRYTKGIYNWIGGSKHPVDFEVEERAGGKSTFGMRSLFGLALEGITGFSTAPLRLSSLLGFTVSVVALIYLVFVLIKYLLYGDPVQGFATLLSVILLMGGIQLICLGIIGEYVGRTFMESKRRPPYIIDTINGSTDYCNNSKNG